MNKIYFISIFFVPLGRANVNRAFMVKYLHEEGWDVEVVTGKDHKSYVQSFQEDPSLWSLLSSDLKIHRFNAQTGWLIYDIKKLLNWPDNVRSYWIREAERNLKLAQKGIIYAITPPLDNAILAHNLACKYDCPLVLHYVDDDVEVGQKIFQRANLVICVTEQIKANLSARYAREDIFVAEHGYLQEIVPLEKGTIKNPLRLIYAGAMTFRTRPEVFAQAYHSLAQKDPSLSEKLSIDFYSSSNYYPFLFLRKYLNRNVQFKGFLAFSELMKVLPQYDIALASTKGEISFASKIYQYLNAGLPIITSSDDQCLKEFIEKNQVGLAANRGIPDVAGKLRELIDHPEQIAVWRKNVIAIKPRFSFKNRIGEISRLLKERF